jgi:hypothetical protein
VVSGAGSYYEAAEQTPANYKGHVQLGTGTVCTALEGSEFLVSASEAVDADSSKPSLLLRAADAGEREQWCDFVGSAVTIAGADPAAAGALPTPEPAPELA